MTIGVGGKTKEAALAALSDMTQGVQPISLQEYAKRVAIAQAQMQASGITAEFPSLDLSGASMGIWGRKAGLDDALREGDRIEVYRPLRVDPKVARRERFRTQGARSAGLFAKKRAGAKPGY